MNWDISCIKIVPVNLHLHNVQILRIAIYAHFKIVDPVCEESREDEVPHSLLEELIILYINWYGHERLCIKVRDQEIWIYHVTN